MHCSPTGVYTLLFKLNTIEVSRLGMFVNSLPSQQLAVSIIYYNNICQYLEQNITVMQYATNRSVLIQMKGTNSYKYELKECLLIKHMIVTCIVIYFWS